ncbi:MAG TPA: hypothetical protein PLQ93_08090 [Bacteroidia bacterium]|nr:hypothetical protein [Bacteroidia bacterium]
MVRFQLKPISENASDPAVAAANALADKSMKHMEKIIGSRKCHKHPSYVNKIKIVAVKGQDPKVEVVDYCCPDFYKAIS